MQKDRKYPIFTLLILLIFLQGCRLVKTDKWVAPFLAIQTFDDYWYTQGAEITRYRLSQVRYGEIHEGDAVLIFVTEGFLPTKQVKAKRPVYHYQVIPILKLIFTKKFYTGIYPYSLMSSIFTPIDIIQYPHTLKVTASTQEWCGQVYSQMNLRDGKYQVLVHSYFEKEADETFELYSAYLEDEIWTRIRIDPDTLPQGRVKMIPGSLSARLLHRKQKVEMVEASLVDKGGQLLRYTLDYEEPRRKLIINFEKRFPHHITSWEETLTRGWGAKTQSLTTRAFKTHSIMTDYWNKNTNRDKPLRKKLGL